MNGLFTTASTPRRIAGTLAGISSAVQAGLSDLVRNYNICFRVSRLNFSFNIAKLSKMLWAGSRANQHLAYTKTKLHIIFN